MQTVDAEVTSAPNNVTQKRRILIVDDHPVFRLGLVKLLEDEPSLAVCGTVGTAADALTFLRQQRCDAAVVDISLPGANGIELVKQILAEHAGLPILLVSMHDESVYALRALRAGALGYVMKRDAPTAIVDALGKILSGQIAVSPAFGEQLIYRMARGNAVGEGSPIDCLSDRELEVLHLVGEGQNSHQIASSLHLSVKTIETHRLHIKEKLGFKSAGEMVRFAMDWYREQSAADA